MAVLWAAPLWDLWCMYNIFIRKLWRYAYANSIPRLLCAVSLYSGQMPHHLLPGMENFCRRQYAKALGSLKSARGFETLYLRSGRSTRDHLFHTFCRCDQKYLIICSFVTVNTQQIIFNDNMHAKIQAHIYQRNTKINTSGSLRIIVL